MHPDPPAMHGLIYAPRIGPTRMPMEKQAERYPICTRGGWDSLNSGQVQAFEEGMSAWDTAEREFSCGQVMEGSAPE